jgi:hypothetical protein
MYCHRSKCVYVYKAYNYIVTLVRYYYLNELGFSVLQTIYIKLLLKLQEYSYTIPQGLLPHTPPIAPHSKTVGPNEGQVTRYTQLPCRPLPTFSDYEPSVWILFSQFLLNLNPDHQYKG